MNRRTSRRGTSVAVALFAVVCSGLLLLAILATGADRGEPTGEPPTPDTPDTTAAPEPTETTDNPDTPDTEAPETEPSETTQTDAPETETEPKPEPETEPEPDDGETVIRETVAAMDDEALLAQMFLVSHPGWANAMLGPPFGGYVFFAEDFENETPESLAENLGRLTARSTIPPLYAADEEGGEVVRFSRFTQFRAVPFDSPRNLYGRGGLNAVRADAVEKAELFCSLGLNCNLAPVADIARYPWDFMYSRSPASDADTVSSIVTAITEEFVSRGVAAVAKHFPGYGSSADTHTAMAWDGRSVEELEAFDLLPFRAAIDAAVSAVMVSHIVTALDPERPATVSPAVVEYLRDTMGYDGVLVTDDMRMGGVADFCQTGNASLDAILAGYDLICCSAWEEQFPVVLDALREGTLTRARLEESVARILRMKLSLGIWTPGNP